MHQETDSKLQVIGAIVVLKFIYVLHVKISFTVSVKKLSAL